MLNEKECLRDVVESPGMHPGLDLGVEIRPPYTEQFEHIRQ